MHTRVLLALVSIACPLGPGSHGPLFAPAPGGPVTVDPGSGTVILADVSGDGHLDLITRHLQNRIVAVLLGNGRGGFAAAAASPIVFRYSPADMKLGDVNNDKVLDLAVTASDRDFVDVLLGDGKGGFTLASGSPFTVTDSVDLYNKRTLHLVDINEDGNLDIVTANGRRRNSLAILLGNGRAGFSPGPTVRLDSGRDRYRFSFGDIDGDGHLDVVTAGAGIPPDDGSGRVVVQRGNGRGAFRETSGSPVSVPPAPGAMALADVNRDGRLDIVISHASKLLSVLLNAGNGAFATAPSSPFHLGTYAYSLVAVDLNRDQKPDLVGATADSVTVFLGDSQGFVPAPGSPFGAGPGAYNVTVGDVNEDGKLDLVASSFGGNAVTVLLGR